MDSCPINASVGKVVCVTSGIAGAIKVTTSLNIWLSRLILQDTQLPAWAKSRESVAELSIPTSFAGD